MTSSFYKPDLDKLKSSLERDLLSRYYDPDALSEKDIAELTKKYPDLTQVEQVTALAKALHDDYIDHSERSHLEKIGVTAEFFNVFKSGQWVENAKKFINTRRFPLNYSDEQRADLIENVDLKSIGGNGIEELELAAKDAYDADHPAIEVLLEMRSAEAVPALARMVATNSDQNVRLRAIEALGRIGSEVVPFLVKVVENDSDWDVRQAAVAALGNIASLEAVQALIEIATGNDSDHRRTAVYYLGQIGTSDTESALIEMLANSDLPSGLSVADIIGALSKTASPKIVPILMRLVEGGLDKDTRKQVAYLLGDIGSPEAISALGQMITFFDRNSFDVVKALGTIASPEVMPILAEVATNKNRYYPGIREEVIEILIIRHAEAVTVLKKIAESDADESVRHTAIEILRQIGTPEAQETLLRLYSE